MTDLTIRELIAAYTTHRHSPYVKKLRYGTRMNYDSLLRRVERDLGDMNIADIDAILLTEMHEDKWAAGGKVAMGHSLVGMVRTLTTFGATFLKSKECRELKMTLHDMRFEMPKARTHSMTVEQVIAIRTIARAMGLSSIARAQTFGFECMFRQKDVIGEVIPEGERGESDVKWRGKKWLRGITWPEIDDDLILRHVTSKRQKAVAKNLKLMPMVIDELQAHYCDLGEPLIIYDEDGKIIRVNRHLLPTEGPIIINERTGYPYFNYTFRREWRKIADAAGIPKHIKQMDTRATAITEALRAGARLQSVRKAATHSTEDMTQKYSRADAEEDDDVARARSADRDRRANEVA